MKLCLILLLPIFLLACTNQANTKTVKKSGLGELTDSPGTLFLIDDCENEFFSAVLEEDKTKGKDSCILRITSKGGKYIKEEILNVPADRSSINDCGEDVVVVGFLCGGPCYSRVFVFTDNRKSEQFSYCQKISNSTELIAHIENEEFNRLLIRNLKNRKEMVIDISDSYEMNYGHMDTLYTSGNNLVLQYPTENGTKKKNISIKKIL